MNGTPADADLRRRLTGPDPAASLDAEALTRFARMADVAPYGTDMPTTADFAGRDQHYLRTTQYADSANLTSRANLHQRYGTAPVPWYPWLAQQIEWPAAARVLEVGCGPGWFWQEAAPFLPGDATLALTDLSRGMVDEARHRAGAAGFTARPSVVDAQALPFTAEQFHVAIAAFMLYHTADPGQAVAELARVLRTDGILLAATNGEAHLRELWEIRAEAFGVAPTSPTEAAFGVRNGQPLLAESFGTVTWVPYPDELHCTDPADVVAYLTSAPPGDSATPAQLRALRDAVADRFATGGPLRVTKETGVFICRQPTLQPYQ